MMDALLVVDLQNDFMPGGALGVEGGDTIIPLVNMLMPKFSLVVASQDWHPPGHVSFAETHGKNPGEEIDINGVKQILWPTHCVEHTHGAALIQTLNKDRIHKYFHKGTDKNIDSYSAFFDNGHIKETGLDAYLREKNVTRLLIVGLTTEYCVKYTALDALELGYEVAVIKDACRPVNLHPHDEKKALEEMTQAGAKILTSADF